MVCNVDFKWTDREWEFIPHDELNAILTMHGPSGNLHEVERLSHDDAHGMLGVQQCLDGSNAMEAEYLTKVAKIWRDEGSESWTGQKPG